MWRVRNGSFEGWEGYRVHRHNLYLEPEEVPRGFAAAARVGRGCSLDTAAMVARFLFSLLSSLASSLCLRT